MKLQTRDVPDEVHKILKHEAVDRGISLNALVVEILSKAAERIGGKGGKA
jgi:predicted HicB family RNase H-like nuclease